MLDEGGNTCYNPVWVRSDKGDREETKEKPSGGEGRDRARKENFLPLAKNKKSICPSKGPQNSNHHNYHPHLLSGEDCLKVYLKRRERKSIIGKSLEVSNLLR